MITQRIGDTVDLEKPHNASTVAAPGGVDVRFTGVGKRFGATTVLHDVDLTAHAGTTMCIIGPSGSGKSTLLRCTNLLEVPDAGSIHVGEQEVTGSGVDVNVLRARVGMVFQNYHLFPNRDVLANVTLALRQVRRMPREQAEEVGRAQLARVGLGGYEKRRPTQLSGGQQQRVAIARSLAMSPDVMLFDEATSALDPELVKGVLAVMRELAQGGMTMLVVTHEMRFAREVAQQVVFVDEGRVVETGEPDELFDRASSTRLREFLGQVL